MAESDRARGILEAVEREAMARRRAADAAPAPPPPAGVLPVGSDAPADRLLGLLDALGARTQDAKRRLDELSATVEELSLRLAPPAEPEAAPPPPAPAPEPAAPPPPRGSSVIAASARLIAIEMAVSGATRGDAAQRLRHEFGMTDSVAILDDVFGRGSGPDSRMPWGASP